MSYYQHPVQQKAHFQNKSIHHDAERWYILSSKDEDNRRIRGPAPQEDTVCRNSGTRTGEASGELWGSRGITLIVHNIDRRSFCVKIKSGFDAATPLLNDLLIAETSTDGIGVVGVRDVRRSEL